MSNPESKAAELTVYECDGHQYVREEIEALTPYAASVIFRKKHPGVRLESVGDFMIIGWCEDCGRPFFDGDEYNSDENGVTWHKGGDPRCVAEDLDL